MYIREILVEKNYQKLLFNKKIIKNYRKEILNSKLLIIKNIFEKKKIIQLKKYLSEIGKSSLPGYHPVEFGAPNHHRIIDKDNRSFVEGKFHQFSFFRWNQDIYDIFNLFIKGYWIKNLLSNNDKERYLNIQNNKKKLKVVARISVQFYPSGMGFMNEHSDPIGQHQISAPLAIMSEKGPDKDFKTGGSYVYYKNKNKKLYIEDIASIGDLVLYDASLPHGVDLIDKSSKTDWCKFKGRWTSVLASNKVRNSKVFRDALDLNKEND